MPLVAVGVVVVAVVMGDLGVMSSSSISEILECSGGGEKRAETLKRSWPW